MGGFFGVASKGDCVSDLYFGTDYHSHLGTRRGGIAVARKDGGIDLEEWKAFSTGHGGSKKSPDMGAMMKAMDGKGGMPAMPGMNAIPSDDAPSAPAMPLIMPPAKPDATPAKNASMPLIMPPKASN